MDFDFNLGEANTPQLQRKFEFWVPLSDDPVLRRNEKDTILYNEGLIESIHLVKPAFLLPDPLGSLSHYPCEDVSYYYTVARLKNSPYMVLFDNFQKSDNMQKFFKDKYSPELKNDYYIDVYYSPNFGTIQPKYFLFERAELKVIPNTMVLFREV